MKRLFEVKMVTYTQVWTETPEEAQAFAVELLRTIEPENVETTGDFQIFSHDEIDVLEDTEANIEEIG